MARSDRHDPKRLAARFRRVRALTEGLAAPLGPEDQCVQSMPDASPTKWHLAHTSWFFETFVLDGPGFERYRPGWEVLFNSYYQTVGAMHPRPHRGLLSRPSVAEIHDYRRWVDERVLALLERGTASPDQLALTELGLHHEQQHQELILTDVKHMLGLNPLAPRYREASPTSKPSAAPALRWIEDPGGLVEIGRDLDRPEAEFGYDNEGPRHKQWLEPFAIASRPATCAEYLAFIEDEGYARSELWLAEGWDTVLREGWRAPAYWVEEPDESWRVFTLDGLRALDLHAPVCHLSYYEAEAFARWSGARLPSEAEWERLAEGVAPSGNLLPSEAEQLASAALHPQPCAAPIDPTSGLAQLFGDVWEWTASPYVPYPGYRPPAGVVGEYNGKFMCNQLVLRGGSCATPSDHIRASYRNFFHAPSRWQFTGLRLARNL
ncbi:MAG: ergothioneine biosynthesis protein EgtB [Enhygromyxa sp.]